RELLVLPALEGRRDDAGLVGSRLVAVFADLRRTRTVDRVRHGPTNRDVLEDRVLEVDEDRDVRDRREPGVVRLALRQIDGLDAGDELAAPLRLAAGEIGVGRVVRGVGRVVDRVDLRLALLPVVVVLRVLHDLRRAGGDGEGTTPDRLLARR